MRRRAGQSGHLKTNTADARTGSGSGSGASKMFSILNAHKPMRLSELVQAATTTAEINTNTRTRTNTTDGDANDETDTVSQTTSSQINMNMNTNMEIRSGMTGITTIFGEGFHQIIQDSRRSKITIIGLLLLLGLGFLFLVYKPSIAFPPSSFLRSPSFLSSSSSWMTHDLVGQLLSKAIQIRQPYHENNNNNNNNSTNDYDQTYCYLVFVTYCNGHDTHVHFGSSKSTPRDAMERAYRKACKKLPTQSSFSSSSPSNAKRYIKVDVVTAMNHISDFSYAQDPVPLNVGFAIGSDDWWNAYNNNDNNNGMVYLHDQVKASALVDRHSKMLRWDHIGKVWSDAQQRSSNTENLFHHHLWPLHRINLEESTVSIDFFQTEAVFVDATWKSHNTAAAAPNVYPLLKVNGGRRPWSLSDITPEALYSSAAAAGNYLIRHVHPDGTMVHTYKPRSDTATMTTTTSTTADSKNNNDGDYDDGNNGHPLKHHAGAAYAMAVLYKNNKKSKHRLEGDDETNGQDSLLRQSLTSVLEYLINVKMVDCPIAYDSDDKSDGDDKIDTGKAEEAPAVAVARCIVNEEYHNHRWTNLGVNAMALLALSEYAIATDDYQKFDAACRGLATWIAGTQDDDGSFVQDQDIDGNRLDEESYVPYFPSEAAFAMARYVNMRLKVMQAAADSSSSKATKSQQHQHVAAIQEIVVTALTAVVNRESDVEDEDFVIDSWMMCAMAEIASWQSKDKHRSMLLTKSMIQFMTRTARIAQERQVRHIRNAPIGTSHHQEDANVMNRDGIFLQSPKNDAAVAADLKELSSLRTARISQGLCAIYPILLQQNEKKRHENLDSLHVLETIKWSARYQLSTQFHPEWSMYMKNPFAIMGAFAKSIVQEETRSDVVQHNIVSILCLANHLVREGDPP